MLLCSSSSSSSSSSSPAEPRYPPVFDRKLSPQEVTVGDSVQLECHMTGSAPIKVTWSKDHKDIRPGGNYQVSCVDNTAHLVLLRADRGDTGGYFCHAHNDVGKDCCSATVSVKGRGSSSSPHCSSSSSPLLAPLILLFFTTSWLDWSSSSSPLLAPLILLFFTSPGPTGPPLLHLTAPPLLHPSWLDWSSSSSPRLTAPPLLHLSWLH